MKRTQARQLVLVNWQGMFYERFLFDPYVTALEGVNGAGKTTVMIAAYVVLLPDMSKLRFTTVGDATATGGDRGIYGRLGEPGRPSYAALDFELRNGRRLVAGVHLERRNEPTVVPTPFLIWDLRPDVRLQDVLLDRGPGIESVPEYSRLRELAALAGGRLQHCESEGDYFSELFEAGVSPLRLTTDEERTKFNEMLRTSMVGGISRTLSGGMRDFLLKAETGLADTLQHMRSNLESCRRSRHQVEETRRLKEEIQSVYDAGLAMFAAAFHATRAQADELHIRVDQAKKVVAEADGVRSQYAGRLATTKQSQVAVQAELAIAVEARGRAESARDSFRKANKLFHHLADLEEKRPPLIEDEGQTRAARDETATARVIAQRAAQQARDAHGRAAQGLAEAKRGYEELEYRAAAFDTATEHLARARSALPADDVSQERLSILRLRCETKLDRIESEVVRDERELATAERAALEHEEVRTALERLTGEPVLAEIALATARSVLTAVREREVLMGELPQLPGQISAARERAQRQQETRRQAIAIQGLLGALQTVAEVKSAADSAEKALSQLQSRLTTARLEEAELAHSASAADERIAGLESLTAEWTRLHGRAGAVGLKWNAPLGTATEVDDLRLRLQTERENVSNRRLRADEALADVSTQRARLAQLGGDFGESLLAARDLVDGDLLAGRFEECPVDEAAELEARLGPLCEAIVVDDPRSAAETLSRETRQPDTVWLVGHDSGLELDPSGRPPGDRVGDSILVSGHGAWRLSRSPEHPTIGRRARERALDGLRTREQELEDQLSAHRTALLQVEADLAELMEISGHVALLERDDPAEQLLQARAAKTTAEQALERHRTSLTELRDSIPPASVRRDALRDLLVTAHLLEEPDLQEVVSALEQRLVDAKAARAWLDDFSTERHLLEDRLDVLGSLPLGALERQSLKLQLDASKAEHEAVGRALRSLRYLEGNLIALSWHDAGAGLAASQALTSGLTTQLTAADLAVRQTNERFDQAAGDWEDATKTYQESQNRLSALDERIVGARVDLEALDVPDPSDNALTAAENEHARLAKGADKLSQEERTLALQVAGLEGELARAEKDLAEAKRKLEKEEREWKPADDRWVRLQAAAVQNGVSIGLVAGSVHGAMADASSVSLWSRAQSEARVMLDRIARARGGDEVAAEARQVLDTEDETRGEVYLRAWLRVRHWLAARVPPQVAEVADPVEALARMGHYLAGLQERLGQQERNLRGQSEDVARSIDTQVRKATRQVTRLSRDLAGVRFGNIQGVQLRIRKVERMEQVLAALREGKAQQLLFGADMPIEEALESVFKQFGGGKAGGHKLLDYREYVDVQVEVQRRSRTDWEVANPNRLSTGEAIGVGASVMMVVLTAWEKDANLLRPQHSSGTLRLLFLDEANRLSVDNLGELFDLCRVLNLQLMIAAPEVAKSEGNTTYQMVREVGPDGREQVVVSGRRVRSQATA